MSTIVVYESIYGNTRAIALAVAEGLGEATAHSVDEAPPNLRDADLLVVGAPTHMHGLSTSMSRRMAFEAGKEDGILGLEPHDELGVRQWLRDLSALKGALAAAFDTRLDRSPTMTGTAARSIARRLRHHGYQILGSESFLVEDAEGPLEDGELERARAWGASLAERLAAAPNEASALPADSGEAFQPRQSP